MMSNISCIKKKPSFRKYPTPKELNEFFNNPQEEVPFTALRLTRTLLWSPEKLTNFFSGQGRFVTDLTLLHVRLPFDENNDELKKYHESYDLKALLGGIINLQTLKIRTMPLEKECSILEKSLQDVTQFKLSLDLLYNIKNIDLENCVLELTENNVISPVNLRFSNMEFTRDKITVFDVVLNDFVNFEVMKKLALINYSSQQNIKLDLNGSVKLTKLSLHYNIDVLNSENSLWEIDILYLDNFPLQTLTNMNIKNIISCSSLIDLSCLPQSLINLSIDSKVENFTNALLPNVKGVEVGSCCTEIETVIESIFPHLILTFTNLEVLKIASSQVSVTIDTDLIPQSVRVLELVYDCFEFVGDDIRKLEVVILKGSTIEFAKEVKNNFAPGILIVYVKGMKPGGGQGLIRKLSTKSPHRMILGIFDWKNPGHQTESSVHNCNNNNVDTISLPRITITGEFYSLINRKGDVITAQSYTEIRKIISHRYT